ncbi:MAG TPA: methylenetetrahydrofolate reductase C-terminal domain-containing protein [Bryobacteraceae bacterium]|nr:methylenetetrahydrofolate reductase C-terminal domain-containing protein [Bryobacteraceae bacterium]
MWESFFRTALARGEFLATAELVLGRDHAVAEAETFVRDAADDPNGARVVSITDLPGGNPALPPEAFASEIRARGLTPIAHITGKDGNRSFLEGRLHALARTGVESVLALTGDAQKEGFAGKAKPVHDLDSVLLLRLIEAMRAGLGYTLGSRTVRTTPFDFFAGAVVNPFKVREPDLMMQLYKMELKIAAGAQYLITQLGFNLRKLSELRQYMIREGLDHVPVLANVYVPTATIARMMQSGELAGCVVSDEFIRRLEKEKKPQRLERAALMVAAARELGFAGAHIGGFGLTHRDVRSILDRAGEIGSGWHAHMDELVLEYPGEFHLLPRGSDGLSDPSGEYQAGRIRRRVAWKQRLSRVAHRLLIAPDSVGARFLAPRLNSERRGFWSALLAPSSLYRKATLGCMSCGDCIQDCLSYAGCSMRWCYKELRNGPCGGSRVDGTCEARPERPCIWNQVYEATLAAGQDPRRFAEVIVPPRDWSLDRTNALVNRLSGADNLGKRQETHVPHR